VARLRETLEVIRLLWSGETVSFEGEHHVLRDARQQPVPLARIPIVIGGAGPATRRLVAEHADWWNVPLHRLDVLDDLAEGQLGSARVSVQQMVALVPSEAQRAEVEATAMRRFGGMAAAGGLAIGDAGELTAHFASLTARGVERVYTWFADFAPPATLAAFAEVVAG
jgi:alkanesulfonate monooxygenase SsuD/methylene tetrahydromethanopterin reductase-like flavin-dependent oxidoreductase (luciferase family)